MEQRETNRGGQNQSEVKAPSEVNFKYSRADLKEMQSWTLERKIQVSQTRILEWYQYWDGKCFVSFSGGKDSTVLAYLCAGVCQTAGYKLTLWFSDTGLEYPEVKQHVKVFPKWLQEKFPDLEIETVIDYPKDKNGKRITFRDVLFKYGYPLISKEVAKKIDENRSKPDGYTNRYFDGTQGAKYGSAYDLSKWIYLRDSNIPISGRCCDVMKKRPSHKFVSSSGLKPLIGSMASESLLRTNAWKQNGCNAFNAKNPSSTPLSFWLEQDILRFIKDRNIPIASVYGDICMNEKGKLVCTQEQREGCMWCGFGVHLEKEPNKFQRMKQTHPKIWEYCMRPVDEGGLGMKEVLEFIGVKTGCEDEKDQENTDK